MAIFLILTSVFNDLGSKETQIATHILQFIFLSDSGFRFPVAHFPTAQCPPSALYFKFWEGVLMMKQAGFTYDFKIISTYLLEFVNIDSCQLRQDEPL